MAPEPLPSHPPVPCPPPLTPCSRINAIICLQVRTGAQVAAANLPFPPNSPMANLLSAFQSLPMNTNTRADDIA